MPLPAGSRSKFKYRYRSRATDLQIFIIREIGPNLTIRNKDYPLKNPVPLKDIVSRVVNLERIAEGRVIKSKFVHEETRKGMGQKKKRKRSENRKDKRTERGWSGRVPVLALSESKSHVERAVCDYTS